MNCLHAVRFLDVDSGMLLSRTTAEAEIRSKLKSLLVLLGRVLRLITPLLLLCQLGQVRKFLHLVLDNYWLVASGTEQFSGSAMRTICPKLGAALLLEALSAEVL